jgi:hypothetical protein
VISGVGANLSDTLLRVLKIDGDSTSVRERFQHVPLVGAHRHSHVEAMSRVKKIGDPVGGGGNE